MTDQSNGVADGALRNTARAMRPRDRTEHHRVSTPLELFFDLCFVVAVAQAGSQLAHALTERHFGHGIEAYFIVFFAIWWAWMNFTWFASAYDTDDVPYRLATLVQIAGALVLAAGVPRAFDQEDFKVCVWGYVIMRIALVTQWVRAALGSEGAAKRMALRYAAGIVVVQVWWVLWVYLVPQHDRTWTFLLGAAADIAVPLLAERGTQSAWHPHHISERYGLFTLIVLGETVSAATIAVQSAVDEHQALGELLPIAVGGLLICFSAWWIYFARPVAHALRQNRQAFLWGYGHYVVFAAAAAIGAGLEVAVEQAVGKAHELSHREGALAVTVPTALFLLVIWALHVRMMGKTRLQLAVYPVATAGVLLVPTVLWAGVVCAAAVAAGLLLDRRPGMPRLST
ncbi:low temperature requirement protein A [Streptacidiphilus monticola]|jgi:low temperature requirement protein LtrA|uniref:Low temperature requirement protein A n=1 Tax=Streptacidiphilus monticola TaxID=2161674 RepID=A0ABW1FYR6_9ACTN